MGYRKLGEAALRRLNEVLEDPDLGLSSGGFDFRFGSREFLCALCDVVGLDETDYLPLIEARQQWLSDERQAFKPYLFIDTGFRRSDRPGAAIFVLAVCEGMRRLTFPEGFWRKSLAEQVQLAQARVREFMAETSGDVKIWGMAHRFLFFHAEDAAIELPRQARCWAIGRVWYPTRPHGGSAIRPSPRSRLGRTRMIDNKQGAICTI
ncbi:hypothetical protein GCM10027040_21100 [Halomonas shantousis]